MDSPEPRSGERIAKLLARAGIASRREVERMIAEGIDSPYSEEWRSLGDPNRVTWGRMIAEGRVKLGEVVVTTPATVLTSLKDVTVDGQPVKAAEPARLFLFHKPSGLITAERDPTGRPTIYTALRNALPAGTPRLMPVGRLDLNTEGLLLLTNDGELKRALELPASGVPRTYRARTFGDITQSQLEELIEGVTIEGVHYGKIDANMERRTGRNQWIEVTLTEGKNREVRRVLEHLGLQVSRLLRVAYGPFILGEMPRGSAGEVAQADVERFCKTLKGLTPAPKVNPHEQTARPRSTWVKGGTAAQPPEPKPSRRKPAGSRPMGERPTGERPARGRPYGERPTDERPARAKPYGERPTDERPARGKPYGERPTDERPARAKPYGDRPTGERPARGKPYGERYTDERPARGKPYGERPTGERPARGKPYGERPTGERPARGKPFGERPTGGKPTGGKPGAPRGPRRP